MIDQEYVNALKAYATKFDKKKSHSGENLGDVQHRLKVKGRDFLDSFNTYSKEFFALEKVDLIDYWNIENGWTNKKR